MRVTMPVTEEFPSRVGCNSAIGTLGAEIGVIVSFPDHFERIFGFPM